MKVFYSPDYVAASHNFATTRKSGWIASDLARRPIPNITLASPTPLDERDILKIHSERYVQAIRSGEPRSLAESQGFTWDPSLWKMVTASNGGVVEAAHEAMRTGVSGSLSSGLHHARYGNGAGCCTFNGLAIAANSILESNPDAQVMILDLDAHGGGGTQSLIHERVIHVDIAVHWYDSHPVSRGSYDLVCSASEYISTIRQRLERVKAYGHIDLCIYNAGMDPWGNDIQGGLRGITMDVLREREALVFDWAKQNSIPIAFVLAGGYLAGDESPLTIGDVVDRHRLTLEMAARIS